MFWVSADGSGSARPGSYSPPTAPRALFAICAGGNRGWRLDGPEVELIVEDVHKAYSLDWVSCSPVQALRELSLAAQHEAAVTAEEAAAALVQIEAALRAEKEHVHGRQTGYSESKATGTGGAWLSKTLIADKLVGILQWGQCQIAADSKKLALECELIVEVSGSCPVVRVPMWLVGQQDSESMMHPTTTNEYRTGMADMG